MPLSVSLRTLLQLIYDRELGRGSQTLRKRFPYRTLKKAAVLGERTDS